MCEVKKKIESQFITKLQGKGRRGKIEDDYIIIFSQINSKFAWVSYSSPSFKHKHKV